MYKIIGADQKEYGPVTAEQLRQWVLDGRANAQTLIQPEGSTDWQPLSAFPELNPAAAPLGVSSTLPPFSSGAPTAEPAPVEEILGRDYSLDIGDCLTRSWDLVKNNFWPVVGVSTLVVFLSAVVNQLFGLFTRPAVQQMVAEHRILPGGILVILGVGIVSTPFYTVLFGGLFKYYLKLIRGEGAAVGDAFSGFGPALGQLVLLGLVQGILIDLGLLLCIIPGIYLSVSWYFAMPLVIDRNLGFWEAMELSRKVVFKHWFLIFAFLLVNGLVSVCGGIACCIGILVSMPIGFVALMYAYEDIFGQQMR
jgi:hypothetical protein